MSGLAIREAAAGDEELIVLLLHELAVYEKHEHEYRLAPADVTRDFLGLEAQCRCVLAFAGNEPVGVMTWYRTYYTFAATRGLFLQDIFVRAAHRGKGYGKALLAYLASQAVAEGATDIEWFVHDWNAPSIAFYESLSAKYVRDWLRYVLDGEALRRLAAP